MSDVPYSRELTSPPRWMRRWEKYGDVAMLSVIGTGSAGEGITKGDAKLIVAGALIDIVALGLVVSRNIKTREHVLPEVQFAEPTSVEEVQIADDPVETECIDVPSAPLVYPPLRLIQGGDSNAA